MIPQNESQGSMKLEDEPICVLKIERDNQNVDEILVYENDEPK